MVQNISLFVSVISEILSVSKTIFHHLTLSCKRIPVDVKRVEVAHQCKTCLCVSFVMEAVHDFSI